MDKSKSKIQNPKSKIQNRNVSPARIAVFEILKKIETEKSFSSVLLPVYEETLQTKDRSLCHELTLGTLRNQIYLDKVIEFLTGKNLERLDLAVILSLRIGLFQILFLDKVPSHAAINESVNLVYRAKKHSAGSFVNAVLRGATREKIELKFADELDKISVKTSHPRWLIEKWVEQFGFEETKALTFSNNESPSLVFRLTKKSDENTLSTLSQTGLEISQSKIVEDAWKISKSNEILRLFAETGKIYFQDEASQLVGQIVDLQENEIFFDVCAAPGSKTTFINGKRKMENGKLFVAGDFHEHRLRSLRENCLRQGADNVKFVRYNAESSMPFAEPSFDVILLDAPCSGTGTIRHNPEIRYFLQPKDFVELGKKQLNLLRNASKLLREGGRLIYSTCSLEREENETVVEYFLDADPNFRKVLPKVSERFLNGEGFARTFPNQDNTDGFFIAVFEKG
ncbi:MAG: 16S rRNA (cytosine(967)-C(5))-methyltransferase RsmB [Pyrinomonadaceae bacterium]